MASRVRHAAAPSPPPSIGQAGRACRCSRRRCSRKARGARPGRAPRSTPRSSRRRARRSTLPVGHDRGDRRGRMLRLRRRCQVQPAGLSRPRGDPLLLEAPRRPVQAPRRSAKEIRTWAHGGSSARRFPGAGVGFDQRCSASASASMLALFHGAGVFRVPGACVEESKTACSAAAHPAVRSPVSFPAPPKVGWPSRSSDRSSKPSSLRRCRRCRHRGPGAGLSIASSMLRASDREVFQRQPCAAAASSRMASASSRLARRAAGRSTWQYLPGP